MAEPSFNLERSLLLRPSPGKGWDKHQSRGLGRQEPATSWSLAPSDRRPPPVVLGGHAKEDRHWQQTLDAFARSFGVAGTVVTETVCVDRRRQWRRAANVWKNAGVRSGIHAATAPARLLVRPFRRG